MRIKKILYDIIKKIKHPFVNVGYGDRSTRCKGSGIEKVDVRPYTPNDHAKYINRKLSAKHTTLLVNEYKKETNPTIDVYMDYNQNRESGIKIPTKTLIFDILGEINKICEKQKAKVSYYDAECLKKNTTKTWKDMLKQHSYQEHQTLSFSTLFAKNNQPYFSLINEMAEHASKNHKQRIICFFSDFLDLNEKGMQSIMNLQTYATVFCFCIPVMNEGKNYIPYTLGEIPKIPKKIYLIPLYE